VIQIFTGVDIIEIERMASVKPTIRTRFLERVFTSRELTECGGLDSSLAGRFAAKEAVVKALGTGIGPITWQEIEILRGQSGAPMLYLHGKAQKTADHLGIETWSVSISHSRTYAVAMAVGAGLDQSGA
jgi:holo-[acyl-carrier protein] synthase